MSDPFIGEIRMMGFNFAPRGWATCDGQLLSIAQNSALFSLLGTMYGGDGRVTFGLPDLRGRAAKHQGQGPGLPAYTMGEKAGSESVTLSQAQMPQHTHLVACQPEDGNSGVPTNSFPAPIANGYSSTGGGTMNPGMLAPAGGNQPVSTLPPYLVVNFCIALEGIFPPRS